MPHLELSLLGPFRVTLAGQIATAHTQIAEILALVEKTGERMFESVLVGLEKELARAGTKNYHR